MKFKPNDKVTIISEEFLEKIGTLKTDFAKFEESMDGAFTNISKKCPEWVFAPGMKKFCGKQVTIAHSGTHHSYLFTDVELYRIVEDTEDFSWVNECFVEFYDSLPLELVIDNINKELINA